MNHATAVARRWGAWLATFVVGLLGVAAIVGSGGGGDSFGDVCANNSCSFSFPLVEISPSRVTAQVGTAVKWTAFVTGVANPSYQWQRAAPGGSFVDIPGATSNSYTLPSATLADDGATFHLAVFSGSSLRASDSARLAVSSMPSISYQDTEFSAGDWTASVVVDPLTTGPMHSEEQALSDGHPGAYRHMTFTLTPGPSSVTVVNLYRIGDYDPAAQGAIHVIDYSEDCRDVPVGTGTQHAAFARFAFQQGSRFYGSKADTFCNAYGWVANGYAALDVSDFVQLSGPACAAGESCPDFSAAGAVIRLGFARSASLPASTAAASIEHDIDNWSVHVWRR